MLVHQRVNRSTSIPKKRIQLLNYFLATVIVPEATFINHVYIYIIYIYIHIIIYTLWLFNIASENGPFIDGLPIKNGDFPWLCYITRGYIYTY